MLKPDKTTDCSNGLGRCPREPGRPAREAWRFIERLPVDG